MSGWVLVSPSSSVLIAAVIDLVISASGAQPASGGRVDDVVMRIADVLTALSFGRGPGHGEIRQGLLPTVWPYP